MTTYRKSCINSTSCQTTERINALYDYIGAVYRNSHEAKYDGTLSEKEKEATLKEFGELKPVEGKLSESAIFTYLEKARHTYLEKEQLPYNTHFGCTDRRAKFIHQLFQNKPLGKGDFLGGTHDDCAPEFGALYMVKGVELNVAAEPEKWIFFIEAYGAIKIREAEVELFKKIAETLKIPIYNPTKFNTFSLDVIEAASKRYHKPRNAYLGFAISTAFFGSVIHGRHPMRSWSSDLNLILTNAGASFNLKPEILREAFFQSLFGKVYSKDQEMQAWLELNSNFPRYEPRLLAQQQELTSDLLTICNQVNVGEIKDKLKQNPERKNSLYQTGLLHQDLVRAVYSTSK